MLSVSQSRVCPKVNKMVRLLQPWNRQVKQMFTVRPVKHKQPNRGMPKPNPNVRWVARYLVMTRQVVCVSCKMELPLQVHRAPQLLQFRHKALDKAVWKGHTPMTASSLPLWRKNKNKVGQPPPARQYVKRVKHPVRPHLVLCKPSPPKRAQLHPPLWLQRHVQLSPKCSVKK